MVAGKQQRQGPAFALLLVAGLSQSTAFRAHRSDSSVSKGEDAQLFVPHVLPKSGGVKRHGAAAPQVGASSVASKPNSYRQALGTVRMNGNGDDSKAGDPMRDLALAAMDSVGDPNQLAAFMVNMTLEDQDKLETLKTDVVAKAKSLPGVTGPLGFFDPLALCATCSEGKLCFYREVELKHGRVAMLATLGFLVAEKFHPLFGGDIDVPSYLAFQQTPLQTFWPAVVSAIAIPETLYVLNFNEGGDEEGPWSMRTDRVAGDIGFDPLGLKPTDPEKLKNVQTKELNNGRLAMLAAAGMVAQELATGQKLL
jgi:hypothetical protein